MKSAIGKSLPSLTLLALALISAPANCQQLQDIATVQSAGSSSSAQPAGHIAQWFEKYDQVRRQAQMSPQERQKADTLLSKGLSIIVPGEEKDITQNLLNKLVTRYKLAAEQMKQLQVFPETEKLHRGYYQYFADAGKLFGDYIKVQNSLFVVDESTGKPIAGGLMLRKQNLEALDAANKALDEQVRHQFGIAPYRY